MTETMKLESHIHLLYKDHMNILHIQNTIVSCLPLCFCSHLVDLTLFYFKIQQAVLNWHFKHATIVVKYLPNVCCFFFLHCIFPSPQGLHTLYSFHDSQHLPLNCQFTSFPSIFSSPPLVSPYHFNSFI